jgi:sulfatase-like protein
LPAPRPEPSLLRTALTRGAHLAVLSAFALAQPLLDILGRNPEFFAIRRSTSLEIVLFALAVTLVPPAVLLALELLVGIASRAAADVLHLVFVAGLAGVVLLHALAKQGSLSGVAVLVVAGAGGAVAALLYRQARPVGSFLTVLAPAPLVFLALFIFSSGISKLVFVSTPHVTAPKFQSKTPVVLIVFDEFSTVSLMDRNERIDARRYPNFAALAGDSTWYRSATTVQWLTEVAVPSILTGILPDPHKKLLPIYSDHPNNIFTLLGGSYRIQGVESLTHMCPTSLCRETQGASTQAVGDTTGSLANDAGVVYLHLVLPQPYVDEIPQISDTWGNFGKHEAREEGNQASQSGALQPCARNVCRFASLFSSRGRPTVYVLHTLLPHVPYLYLPSGRRYGVEVPVLRGLSGGHWQQVFPTLQSYQRYLLQLEYTDRALGFMLRRLRAAGLYDRALVIALADHGVSFRHGQPRRYPTPRNLQDIAFVPLFVKLPHQRRGRIDDGFARTVDVVPTIARVLGHKIPWHVDGRPLVGRRLPAAATVSLLIGNGKYATADLSELRAQRARALREQLATFGTTPSGLYRIGPHRELVGRLVSDLSVRPSHSGGVELEGQPLLRTVARRSDLLPTYVQGQVTGQHGQDEDLAVAVNGRIAAVTQTFQKGGQTKFAAMVPEDVMHDGRNDVSVFLVRSSAGTPQLEELRGSSVTTVLRAQAGGEVITSSGGKAIRVDPGAVRGEVRVSSGSNVVFSGFAADPKLRTKVDAVMVFVDGQQVFGSRASQIQPHSVLGQKAAKQRFAFRFELPSSLLPAPGSAHRVRVFAVLGAAASELTYASGYPWKVRSGT